MIYLLKYLSKKYIPSCIKKSTDFLKKYQGELNENSKIVTFDVVSLYTTTSHNLGVEKRNYYLTNYETHLLPRFKKELKLESFEFVLVVLENNASTLEAEYFLQIQRTTMSAILDTTYATSSIRYI